MGVQACQLIAGRYRLIEQAGAGGQAVVWRAHDEELDREVAIKHARAVNAEVLRREARLLARVRHPHVVQVFDVARQDGELWLVMEYVAGQTLVQLGALPPEQVARFGAQLAGALAAVHEAGVVHRDLSPANVLISADGRARLSDFGISRDVHGDVTLTGAVLVPGTPGYLAPEIANGGRPSCASDVFALGATLYAAVEGRSPFGSTDENPMALLRRAMDGDVASSRRAGPLAPVLAQLMRVSPTQRPTAEQAQRMLSGVAEQSARGRTVSSIRWRAVFGARALRISLILATVGALALWAGLRWWPASPPVEQGHRLDLGDPRTIDPCSVADPDSVARFGPVQVEADLGNFNRCDLMIRPVSGKEVNVQISFENPTHLEPEGRIERVGDLEIVRITERSDQCERTVLLPDRHQIQVKALTNVGGEALCEVAEAATTGVVHKLTRHGIVRRTGPVSSDSLFNLDACTLPSLEGLSQYPGVDALRPEVGLGRWLCRWSSTTSPGSLAVFFDRNPPLNASNGRPLNLAGHRSFLSVNGFGSNTCRIDIVHREYTTEYSRTAMELVLVVVAGPQPAERRCEIATRVAESVASALPPV
ncbi:serine/threonine-protein kinase [Nocardia cyriacigeorgica]|uniref:serine/threonine-protein kinase n=1 Tax=Nocardia cyriacigeorgica TaxID=135487 RepID=UPI001895BBDC|nr:serine/threonine-protein kinase [Nocardia cyriacigeorgica]MBF6454712.1 serine/threonine protein kinase [Nocardia cyriacigeorgica]MBF6480209.1 serine/threonine protein kinase [Nocardia cyriacigeorgica]MBF6552606.1 serine/threonine protein kinase [Nocardia cyriacigeorgica]